MLPGPSCLVISTKSTNLLQKKVPAERMSHFAGSRSSGPRRARLSGGAVDRQVHRAATPRWEQAGVPPRHVL